MTPVSPHEAAIAVARAFEDNPALGQQLLVEYVRDGVDPLRIAWAACRLLATADRRITEMAERPRGEWLASAAATAARSRG